MDSRLIFLHRIYTELWGHSKGSEPGKGKTGPSAKLGMAGKSTVLLMKRDGERSLVAKSTYLRCQEKPLLLYMRPYRKPTQVGKENIHRPAGEALLRNSAK